MATATLSPHMDCAPEHEELFTAFVAAWRAGNQASDDDTINDHADRAGDLFWKLLTLPPQDPSGLLFQMAAGQLWESNFATGGSFRDDAAAAAYYWLCLACGRDPLEEIVQ